VFYFSILRFLKTTNSIRYLYTLQVYDA